MTFNALHMSGRVGNDLTKRGFSSFEEADLHILRYLCSDCHRDYDNKYDSVEFEDGEIVTTPIQYACETQCGAEWMIEENE